MSAKLLITRICSCVLMIAISACTSLQTYGLDQINADLPFETGDEITVYLNDENFSERTIIVGELPVKRFRVRWSKIRT